MKSHEFIKLLSETSSGSTSTGLIAVVNNPLGKSSEQVGSLFGGTYTQEPNKKKGKK